jgi:hypothetical protein
MDYSTQFPVRASFSDEPLKVLIEALKSNEKDFNGSFIADDARELKGKIEKQSQRVIGENGETIVSFGFSGDDGAKFIAQLMATSLIVAEYRELLDFTDEVVAENASPAEMEV